jgi:hypothetical protein
VTENRRRWLMMSLVVGAIVAAIALLTTLLTMGGGAKKTGAIVPPSPTATTSSPTPTPTAKPKPKSTPPVAIPTLTPAGGWGLADPAARHTLLIELVSSRPVYVQIGWKAPTSAGKVGIYKGRTTDWSRSMTVFGSPQYVVFYTYYGGAEAPVTCRVFVDGALRTSKTSTGSYGGVMCVG